MPDESLWGAEIPWLQKPEQDSCWVLWVKLPAWGLHPTVPEHSTGRQGSSEGHFSRTRLIKGLFQLPGSDTRKKELVWDCLQEPLLQPPTAKVVLPPHIRLFIPYKQN